MGLLKKKEMKCKPELFWRAFNITLGSKIALALTVCLIALHAMAFITAVSFIALAAFILVECF